MGIGPLLLRVIWSFRLYNYPTPERKPFFYSLDYWGPLRSIDLDINLHPKPFEPSSRFLSRNTFALCILGSHD